ncbi:hypothetical protein FRC18_005439 [Serendipita sp. 400]|nr:hypothetical protein FRC18_005439 [Serendipita sp. 400]
MELYAVFMHPQSERYSNWKSQRQTTSSVASSSSSSSSTGDQDTQIRLLGVKRSKDSLGVESDAEDDEDYSPKKRRSVQRKRTRKTGKELWGKD